MSSRPTVISKLAMYLQSKEPLIYLFIINTDFIPDVEGKYLGPFSAGVRYINRRVIFYYKPDFLENLSAKELYFLILHEAFHIFKRHLERHNDLENRFLVNYAQDAVINYEIEKLKFSYDLVPSMIKDSVKIPDEFYYDFKSIGNDAIETNRIYYWLINNGNKIKKSDLLKVDSKVKIKSTGEYGKITETNKKQKKYEVKIEKKTNWYHEDDLIPVLKAADCKNGIPSNSNFEYELEIFQDKHFDHEKENGVEEKLFTEKIMRQAKKMESNLPKKLASNNIGNLISTLEQLFKPKVNWKRELNKRMNIFYSENSFVKEKVKNIINYPWNAVSQYGILGKYWIEMVRKLQTYVIFAIDTSGSVFHDKYEMETFFTEIDAAAKELEFNRRGQILTIQWDTKIQTGLKVYSPLDWKKFKIEGGGGTSPECVFEYLEKIFKKVSGGYLIQEKGINFAIPGEKKLPFLVFLTDGQFFHKLTEDDLRIYKNNKKNVLYFTRSKKDIFPKENFIIFNS